MASEHAALTITKHRQDTSLQIPFPPIKGGALTTRYGKGVNSTMDDGAIVCVTGEVAHTLTARADSSEDGTGRGTPIDNGGTEIGVRRLTPLECERLQGFPDGHTEGQSDAQRYRQLGNAVAVPVVEWIVKRLAGVDSH